MPSDLDDLPLFFGPHIPAVRFRSALQRLDMRAACEDAPERWRDVVKRLADLLTQPGGIIRVALSEIHDALEAEALLEDPPLPVHRDGRAFAWYLLDAGVDRPRARRPLWALARAGSWKGPASGG